MKVIVAVNTFAIEFDNKTPFGERARVFPEKHRNVFSKTSKCFFAYRKMSLRVDKLVYELYGLTEEEIKIVEEKE
jgi:hypothetical protein